MMRFLFRLFMRSHTEPIKLAELERKIANLEMAFSKKGRANHESLPAMPEKKERDETEPAATIQIEHLQVDQIIIEKLDYANNFGQLGIKDLSGKLNIGTSCEGDFAKEITEKLNKKLGDQARVHLRAKQGR